MPRKKKLSNKCIYLPAIGSNILVKKDIPHKLTGKSLKFYDEDNAQYYYPHFLVSAGSHHSKKNMPATMKYDKDKGIKLGDSGGYQLWSGALKYSWDMVDKILNWLEENTNYAMNIDFPPGGTNTDTDEFKKNLDISYNNYEYFAKNRKGNAKLMNVLHGNGTKKLEHWYNRVKEFDFEGGWGIGSVKDGNIYYALLNFFFLYEKGEVDRYNGVGALFHFLGISKINYFPYFVHLQNKLNELGKDVIITFDSSYPFLTATFGHFFYSITDKGFKIFTISYDIVRNGSYINKDARLPCSCPICKDLTFGHMLDYFEPEHKGNNFFYHHLGLHNFYKMMEYQEQLEDLMSSGCSEIYESYFSTKSKRIMQIIDKCFEVESPTKYLISVRKDFSKDMKDYNFDKKSLF